jgi:hypothetical protein
MSELRYVVKTFRDVGLEAKWDKTQYGQPYIRVRSLCPVEDWEKEWIIVNTPLFEAMKRDGVVSAYRFAAQLCDIFSIPVR